MHKSSLTIIGLISFVFVFSQNTPIYSWQEHLSYKSSKSILEVNDNIYCATKNGLYHYNKLEYLIHRHSKVSGLSDVGIAAMAYDRSNEIIVLAYNNTNIDLIKNGDIVNIPDIKIKQILGEKKINSIYVKDNIAYLSCSFGLVLLDLVNEEIIDTYKLLFNGDYLKINSCSSNDSIIYAGTNEGLYFASLNSDYLFDYNNWDLDTNYQSEVYNVISEAGLLIVDTSLSTKSVVHSNNYIVKSNSQSIEISSITGYNIQTVTNSLFENIQYAIIDEDNILWVADSINSLMRFDDFQYSSTIKPSGPSSNDIKKINLHNGIVSLMHESKNNSVSKSEDLMDWWSLNEIERVTCEQSSYNGSFYGTSNRGLYSVNSDQNVTHFNMSTTNNTLDTNDQITSLLYDDYGNLWGARSNSSYPLFCRSLNSNWHSFNMPFVANASTKIGEIIIDEIGQKWGIIKDNGLFVYNDNGTIENSSDDQFTKINTSIGNGNLPVKEVYDIKSDLNGYIWVGTKTGICVFYSPSSIFSGYNYDAQQIIVEEDGFGQYLLESEIIYSIAIDGGNRKWIGTLSSGLYLLSEDGTEEIHHFTNENSPLMSNTIIDLEVNGETGEVLILTDLGLMSFRSDATSPINNKKELTIYPNPVREGYNGYITIEGLSSESKIKITDINGNLVFETQSNGGSAVWNGKDHHNNKVSTGVYLVFSSSEYSTKKKSVGKILIIK